MAVNVALEADLATIPDVVNVAPVTAVGIPPSEADSLWDEMRVLIGRHITILRPFDPGEDIVTEFPNGYVTQGGVQYVSKTGDPYITKVSM